MPKLRQILYYFEAIDHFSMLSENRCHTSVGEEQSIFFFMMKSFLLPHVEMILAV